MMDEATMTQTVVSIFVVLVLTVVGCRLPSTKGRQVVLLAASYLFYASWGIGFLSILISSSLMNYTCGWALRRKATAPRLWIGIALNLLPLAFFKYLPVLLELGPADSWQYELGHQILLPVGMSFWTFQGLSYLFDIYFEEELDPSLLEFCLYMAFWPTVLSGPICRLPSMLPQFRQLSPFSWDDLSAGSLRFFQGVIMKFVLAQILGSGWHPGEGITAGFDQMKGGWGGVDVWLLGIGFGFLLFFDFAGYSQMVIGIARIFGIRVAENFDRPFLSPTPSIFWTRWHMSLSFWIRDYLFNPLAAAGRRYSWWPYVVLIISMTFFGLWHGAKWTFVVYGLYHGLILVMHRLGQQMKRQFSIRPPRNLGAFLSWGTTFLLVSVGIIIFRAADLTQVWTMLRAVFTPAAYGHFAMPRSFYILMLTVAVGYFVVTAGHALLLSWRARYREAIGERRETVGDKWPVTVANKFTWIIGALFDFFTARLWWWLAPALSILVFWVGLVMDTKQEAVIAVTPFIYTLF
jgi:alginate O-acetyltransferase complex protein AlgI